MRLPVLGLLVGLLALACDSNVEPYVPGETAERPDLARIFPEGAERAADAAMTEEGAAVPGGLPPPPGGAPPAAAGGDAARIAGTVSVSPELASSVPEGAVLFLIARGAAGPPLAARRVADPRLPLAFDLGPEDRMMQDRPFEGPMQLSARLDAGGNATTREPGDLQGAAAGPVEPGASGVEIVLDEVL